MEYEFKSDKYKKECPEKNILDKINEISELYHEFLSDDCRDNFTGEPVHYMTFDEMLTQYHKLISEIDIKIRDYELKNMLVEILISSTGE